VPEFLKHRSISAAADVYWGNCDKVFRNHPVAVAETRAEGRALRKGLRLRKVVTADEIAKDVVDHDQDNSNTINHSQLNFFDVFGKRLNINIIKLLDKLAIDSKNIYNISYDDAVKTITTLSSYQQSNDIPQDVIGYDPGWK
jgi:SNF2 family DNA or RNA helicase